MTNEQIIIDASKCEWRTGVEHCGDYECMLNKCCDYNCDWYKRRKLEQQLQAKEQECDLAKKIVKVALDDFSLEYGTPQYDRLLNGAKSLGIGVKNYE